jgi:molybdopterin-guanine dinucleotide biosynthesis protein A
MDNGNLINGLILAGGKSSRMGKDKSLLEFHGKPQIVYLQEILKPFCNQIFLSVQKDNSPIQGKYLIHDLFDIESPLNGILSAFHYDTENAWLTVPVDMPNINTEALQYLLAHRDKSKSATCFYDSEGENPEPLLTLWEPRSRPQLFNFFNQGEISPRKFLQENDVCILNTPNSEWLLNVNTPEEFEEFRKQHLKGDRGTSPRI